MGLAKTGQWNKIPASVTFSAASYVSMGVNLIQGLLLSRILGPEVLGLWLSLMLVVNYGQRYHLGTVNFINRRIPLLLGRNEAGRVEEHTVNSVSLLTWLSLLWLLLSLVVTSVIFPAQRSGAIVVCLVTVNEVWYQYYLTLSKTDNCIKQRWGVGKWGSMNWGP